MLSRPIKPEPVVPVKKPSLGEIAWRAFHQWNHDIQYLTALAPCHIERWERAADAVAKAVEEAQFNSKLF